jgi:preprotein translocase subunit YajC
MEAILIYLALLAVAFFLLIVRPQRRQLAARRALIESLVVGDEIITAGGIYGTIRRIEERTIDLEVADGIVLRLAREAVSARRARPGEGGDEPGGQEGDGTGDGDGSAAP